MRKGFRRDRFLLVGVVALALLLGIWRAADLWRSLLFNQTAVTLVNCVQDSRLLTFVWSKVREPCTASLMARSSLLSGFQSLANHQTIFLAQLKRGLGDESASELLTRMPENSFTRILAADAAFVAGKQEQARTLYRESCPTFLYRGRAEKALAAAAWEEAEFYFLLFHDCALEALDSYPVVYTSPAPDYAALAAHFLAQGQYPEAEAWYQRAYFFAPNPGYLILSAVAQRSQDRTSEALATLEQALQASTSDEQRYWAYREIGQTYLAAGEFQQAQQAFSQALSISAKEETLFLMAEASYGAGDAPAACRYLEQVRNDQAESLQKVDQLKARFKCQVGAP